MSILNKIKDFFIKKKEVKEESTTINESEPEQTSQQQSTTLDKFDAEFHNPRLNCFYCNQTIESGRVRFFKAPQQNEESAFHKRCFKKLKEGKLPGQ